MPNPKSRMSQTASKAKLWEFDDSAALLAWLDYCIEDHHNFRDTIVNHLRVKVKKKFTWVQVKDKLVDFRRGTKYLPAPPSPKGYSRMAEILEKGTSCLPLAQRNHELVTAAKRQLSIYRTAGTQGPNSATSEGEQLVNRTTNADRRNIPKHLSDHSSLNRQSDEEDSPTIQQSTIGPNIEETQHDDKSVKKADRLLQQKYEEIRLIREQWGKESDALYQRQSELIAQNLQLQAQIQANASARQLREEHNDDSIVRILSDQTKLLSNYRRRIHEAEEGSRFSIKDPVNVRDTVISKVNTFVENIQSELDLMMYNHKGDAALRLLKIAKQSNLALLLRGVFGENRDILKRLRICIAKFGIVSIVRILTLAAVRDWVFMTDYDIDDLYVEEDPLLHAYRQEIMFQGGWKTLRDLEKAAFLRVIDQTPHSEVKVPRVASVLAARLSSVLAPFFVSDSEDSENLSFNSWGEEPDIWKDRCQCFRTIFEQSLQLKNFTATTDMRYGLLIVSPVSLSAPVSNRAQNERLEPWANSQGNNHRAVASMYVSEPVVNEAQTQTVTSAIIHKTNFDKQSCPTKGIKVYTRSIVIPIDVPRPMDGIVTQLPLTNTPTSIGEPTTGITHENSDTESIQGLAAREIPGPGYSPISSRIATDSPGLPSGADTGINQHAEISTEGSRYHDSAFATGADIEQDFPRNDTLTQGSTSLPRIPKETHSKFKRGQGKKRRPRCSTSSRDLSSNSARNRHEKTVNEIESENRNTSGNDPIDTELEASVITAIPRRFCNACKRKFRSQEELQVHENKNSCCRCVHCDHQFPDIGLLKQHQTLEHRVISTRRSKQAQSPYPSTSPDFAVVVYAPPSEKRQSDHVLVQNPAAEPQQGKITERMISSNEIVTLPAPIYGAQTQLDPELEQQSDITYHDDNENLDLSCGTVVSANGDMNVFDQVSSTVGDADQLMPARKRQCISLYQNLAGQNGLGNMLSGVLGRH